MNIEKHVDTIYLSMVKNILANGVKREDRTGTGTISLFGGQQRYDLREGFPLLTTKKVYSRGVFGELIFFLTGQTNNKWLTERKVTIWNEWAAEDGDLGPIYGYQWRHFGAEYTPERERDKNTIIGGVDQVKNLLISLKEDPFSRRHILSAWNPSQLEEMALPPCHLLCQFYVTPDEKGNPYGLSCQLYQRSQDTFLGAPFNIASYAALTHLLAELSGLTPLEFIHTQGDSHIYLNHLDQVKEQLSRENNLYPMPKLKIHHPTPIDKIDILDSRLFDNYSPDSFEIIGYQSHPTIKAPVSI